MRLSRNLPLAAALAIAVALSGCGKRNRFVPPPPPSVGVAHPVSRVITPVITATGTLEAADSVDLVARVSGFVQSIDYTDGTPVKKGQTLFVIEPAPYQAKLQQAQATLNSAEAQAAQSQAEYNRQASLASSNVASRSTLDQAKAAMQTAQANVTSAQAGVALAGINLGYTRVTAPFDGVATEHLVSVGDLVGASGPTKLASVVSLDPIWASFSLSDAEVQRIHADLAKAGKKLGDLSVIEVDVGLASEKGTPHRGHLDYASPTVDTATGTLPLRATFDNPGFALLPGYFVRVRIPEKMFAAPALLVAQQAIMPGQGGDSVLVVGKDDVVEQRVVETGESEGALRVIRSGLAAGDRVIVDGAGRVEPGERVTPHDVAMPGG